MSRRKSKVRKSNSLKLLLASLAGVCLGYYLLNHVATWEEEDRFLGRVFYIISGCILMAVSFLMIVMVVQRKYFPKKRRQGSKPVFLDDTMKRDKNT